MSEINKNELDRIVIKNLNTQEQYQWTQMAPDQQFQFLYV